MRSCPTQRRRARYRRHLDPAQGLCSEDLAENDPARDGQVDAGCRDHERGADAHDGQDRHVLGEQRQVAGRPELSGSKQREDDDQQQEEGEGDQDRCRRELTEAGGRGLDIGRDVRRRLDRQLGLERGVVGAGHAATSFAYAPEIAAIRRSTSASPRWKRATRAPRRMTSIRSETSSTSGRLCEMRTTARPRFRTVAMSSSTFASG